MPSKLSALILPLLLCSTSTAGDLPRVSTWNTGENQRPADDNDVEGLKGFTPDWQHARLLEGEPILPAFELHNRQVTYEAARHYYEPLLTHCAEHRLPISLVMQNLADMPRVRRDWPWYFADGDTSYNALPDKSHPWLVRIDENGAKEVERVTCPWGAVEPWHQIGKLIGRQIANSVAIAYADPPVVYLCDNGEVGWSGTGDNYALALEDYRCPADLKVAADAIESDPELIAKGVKPARFLTTKMAVDAYAVRLGEFRRGLNEALPDGWKDKVVLTKYGVWGNEFGRVNNDWLNSDPFGPLGRLYDGVECNVGYLHGWSAALPWLTRCPQFEACNTYLGLRHFRQAIRPDFYCDLLFVNDKHNAGVTPDIWEGMVQQCLWTIRPDDVRYYSGSTKPVAPELPDYSPLLHQVRLLHQSETLARFWQRGQLLKNEWEALPKLTERDEMRGYGHPYRYVPAHSSFSENRWYQQHVPINSRVRIDPYRDTGFHRENWRHHDWRVLVHALCLQDGDDYLLIVAAPGEPQEAVEIQVCPDGPQPRFTVTVDVPTAGAFYLRRADGTVHRIGD